MCQLSHICFLTLLLYLLEEAQISSGFDYACSYVNNANWCTVPNVTIRTSDDIDAVTFPNVSLVNLKQPIIDYLSPDLLRRMFIADHIEVDGGVVPRIYIKPTLIRLSAHRNHVREVIIDPEDNYYMEHLGIAYNNLKTIPININYLKHLARLHLHDNEIEMVNMDQFKNLSRLSVLALHRNKIHRIDTTIPLKLTNLAEMHLYGNQLQQLLIGLWDFPNLETMHLASNKFYSIRRFPEHFPRLSVAALGGNRWSCAWMVRYLVPSLKQGILKVSGDKQCLGNKAAGICCDGKPEDLAEFLMDSLGEQIERNNIWMIQQQRSIENLGKKLDTLSSKVLNLEMKNDKWNLHVNEQIDDLEDHMNNKIRQLQQDLQLLVKNQPNELIEQLDWFKERLNENRASIDDIIEDMYLEELRKHHFNVSTTL